MYYMIAKEAERLSMERSFAARWDHSLELSRSLECMYLPIVSIRSIDTKTTSDAKPPEQARVRSEYDPNARHG